MPPRGTQEYWEIKAIINGFIQGGSAALVSALVYKSKKPAIMLVVGVLGFALVPIGMAIERFEILVGEIVLCAGFGAISGDIVSTAAVYSEKAKKSKRPALAILMAAMIISSSTMTLLPTTQAATSNSLQVYRSSNNVIIKTDELTFNVQKLSSNHFLVSKSEQNGGATFYDVTLSETEVVVCNRTETFEENIETSKLENSTLEPNFAILSVRYWWDGVYFIEGYPVKYPHPDKSYYGISIYDDWAYKANKLWHYQFNKDTSEALVTGGIGVIAAAIGVAIAALGAGEIAPIITAVVSAVLGWYVNRNWLDEDSCLWFWVSRQFVQWLGDNAWWLAILWLISPVDAVAAVMAAFLSCGYLRVGSLTYYDAVGAGNPSPPPPPPPLPPYYHIPGGGGSWSKWYGPFVV
ncbi:MAG: hypothetical protein QXE76_04620 [Candidatus Bathyarchaeia archaeon]